MTYDQIILLIRLVVFVMLPYFGLYITIETMGDRIEHHIDLGFKIICCFIMWGFMGGSRSYVISWTDSDGKEKTITIGE